MTRVTSIAAALSLTLQLIVPFYAPLTAPAYAQNSKSSTTNCDGTTQTAQSGQADQTTPAAQTLLIGPPPIESAAKEAAKRPRVCLVLGGGGLRGVAHIGVIQVLRREHIPIDLVVGTSIGAIVGGLYCSGDDFDQLEKVAVKQFIDNFYTAPIWVQLLKIPFKLLALHNPMGLYAGGKLTKAVDERVGGPRDVSTLSPKFAAVAADLVEGNAVVYTSGDLATVLKASTAVPMFRSPVKIDDRLLVDGGVLSNLPVREARRLGADFIIAVDIDEKLEPVDPKVFKKKIGSISSRVIGMMLAKTDQPQVEAADFCIQPDVVGITLLTKDPKDGDLALKAGYCAAESAMPELKRKLIEAHVIPATP